MREVRLKCGLPENVRMTEVGGRCDVRGRRIGKEWVVELRDEVVECGLPVAIRCVCDAMTGSDDL